METFVGKLLEIESRARSMTEEARAHYDRTLAQVEAEQAALRESYHQRAERHIAEAAEAENAAADQAVAALEERHSALSQALEQRWQAQSAAWCAELVARCKKGG